jgi:hypothetical protein
MVTEYVDPLLYVEAKVCVLFVVKVKESALLSCTTSVPVRPVAATLIVKFETQVALTVVFAVMVPLALLPRVQVCPVG